MVNTRVVVTRLGRLLLPLGWEQVGRAFRRVNDVGDWCVIDVQRSMLSQGDRLVWFVNVSVLPEPYMDAMGWSEPTLASGMWCWRLSASRDAYSDSWTADGDADLASKADLIAASVESEVLPAMDELLDRDRFLQLARESRNAMGVVVALVDRGPSDELSHAIERLVTPNAAAWARQRAALQSAHNSSGGA